MREKQIIVCLPPEVFLEQIQCVIKEITAMALKLANTTTRINIIESETEQSN